MEKGIFNKIKNKILFSCLILVFILCFNIFKNSAEIDLFNYALAPSKTYPFGTDMLGRNLYFLIPMASRLSFFLGLFSASISLSLALAVSGFSIFSNRYVDNIMIKFIDILLAVPNILLLFFIRSIFTNSDVLSLSISIALCNFMDMAKLIRAEFMQLKNEEYIEAAKALGAGRIYMLYKHFIPAYKYTIIFMFIHKIKSAIMLEASLSFLGLGLDLDTISLGTILSSSKSAFISASWWIIIIPGLFLIGLLLSLSSIAQYIRMLDKNKKIY